MLECKLMRNYGERYLPTYLKAALLGNGVMEVVPER